MLSTADKTLDALQVAAHRYIHLPFTLASLKFFLTARQNFDLLLIFEVSRLFSDTPHSVGLLWMKDQPDASRDPHLTTHSAHKRQTSKSLAGFEQEPADSRRRH